MIKQFRDNMDLMLELVRKILNLKPKDKLVFKDLNETFDEEFSSPSYKDDKLLNKMDSIYKIDSKILLSFWIIFIF